MGDVLERTYNIKLSVLKESKKEKSPVGFVLWVCFSVLKPYF